MTEQQSELQKNGITYFAKTNFRNQDRIFGIKQDDRRRHMYLIGKTGMGKTTAIENMVISDIRAGHGLALVDPHGDLVEKVLDFIPSYRINDVIYLNPADLDNPIGFNVLENVDPDQRHLVASGLMGVFTKIWEGVWSARMEYILNNCILALLEYPGSTMLGIARILVDKNYRKKVTDKITDPIVKSFWIDEFNAYNVNFRNEAIAPIQNKVGQFLSSSIIRNIVGQPKSTIDLRELMDNQKILLLNLSKGRLGEDSSALLGAMMITRLQLAAMSRVDIPEDERKDFYLYVDEFQNFATESFASILSEARKYRLDLTIAHQYIEQLDEKVQAAVLGNVGTIVCFRIGAQDAELLAKEFFPTFVEEDLLNLTKFNVYMKLMIDGVASEPFSATTLPPLKGETNNRDKVIKVSRERYSKPRQVIEEKIIRWTGIDEIEARQNERETLPPRKNFDNRDNRYNGPPPVQRAFTPKRTPTPTPTAKPLPKPQPAAKQVTFQNLESVTIEPDEKPISLQEAFTRQPKGFNRFRREQPPQPKVPEPTRPIPKPIVNKPSIPSPTPKPIDQSPRNFNPPNTLRPGQVIKMNP